MKKRWYSILPWMALVSGVLAIILSGLATVLKPSVNIESKANRKIAYDKLKQIRIDSSENINNNAFFNYFENTLSSPVINSIWLVSAKGEIIYAKGMMTQSTPLHSNIYSLNDPQSLGLIDAVTYNLDSVQKGIIYLASTIRGEGEHNDILGHLVMPLKTNTDVLVGFIGVAYSLDGSEPPFQYFVIIIALGICFLLYWLLLPLWVYFDSHEKKNNPILWTLFVLLGNIPAFIAYLITNRK
jgi:hypothetical protein